MLNIVPNPECTFVAYTVLYHEAVCVALLELVLFHSSVAESLEESAGDLLEYAYDAACQLLITTHRDTVENESAKDELLRQQKNLTFDIGIRSLSILRYISDNLTKLTKTYFFSLLYILIVIDCSITLNVTEKIFNVYDVPVLFAEILLNKPWIKDGKQYKSGQWIDWDGERVPQPEVQVCTTTLLLLNNKLYRIYYRSG